MPRALDAQPPVLTEVRKVQFLREVLWNAARLPDALIWRYRVEVQVLRVPLPGLVSEHIEIREAITSS
jgi:hypothetical protein